MNITTHAYTHVYMWIDSTYFSEAHGVFTALSANVVVVAVVSAKVKVAAARRNASVEFK